MLFELFKDIQIDKASKYFKRESVGARETDQQLRALGALVTLTDDQGSIPSTHGVLRATPNSSPRGADVLFWTLLAPGMRVVQIYTCRQSSHAHTLNQCERTF